MKAFINQLKWQTLILNKNNVISISVGITVIYGMVLFFFNDFAYIDELLIFMIMNDPAIIGFFFIALSIFIEQRHQIWSALSVGPLEIFSIITARLIVLALLGLFLSVLLAWIVKGLAFNVVLFSVGVFGVTILSALIGVLMVPYSNDFMKFAILSIPIFVPFVNVPLLNYLGAIHLGSIRHLFPIQVCLDMIDAALMGESGSEYWLHLLIMCLWIGLFYMLTRRIFYRKMIYT